MSTTKDDGGPAFPVPDNSDYGMTLRDYFAAAALPQICQQKTQQAQELVASLVTRGTKVTEQDSDDFMAALIEGIAAGSYAVADAMLRARNQ